MRYELACRWVLKFWARVVALWPSTALDVLVSTAAMIFVMPSAFFMNSVALVENY